MCTTQELGRIGEEIAACYIENNGYRIQEKNVRFGKYELDIVAFDPSENMIVFIEVKTRTHSSSTYPIHSAMHQRKRTSMRKAVAYWLLKHQYDGLARIDVISVSGGRVIEHLKNLGSDFF